MDEIKEFDLTVGGYKIHFVKDKNDCFTANISLEWMKKNTFVRNSVLLADYINSIIKGTGAYCFVQPNLGDFSFTVTLCRIPRVDFEKVFWGDTSAGEPVGMATEAKEQEETVKPETIKAIESILSKGDRAEVIPTKDGVKVVRIRREPVK